jgi:translation initiation factor 1
MSKNKKRIETSGVQQGLNSAFSHMEVGSLPLAPEPPPLAATAPAAAVKKLGRVILRRETAHRGGKSVIIIYDFPTHLPLSHLDQLAKKLRMSCGCGGTVKEREIEIQGDQPQKIRQILVDEGYQVAGVK